VTVAKSASVKVEDEVPLEQQENLQIKGSKARSVMMQKLLRKSEVKLKILQYICTVLFACGLNSGIAVVLIDDLILSLARLRWELSPSLYVTSHIVSRVWKMSSCHAHHTMY